MKKTLPPVYFFGAIIVEVLLHFLLPLHQLLVFPWRLLGLVFLVIGLVLNALAAQKFKKHETTVKPFEESRALVTGGVFNIGRNPMYLGMSLILFGLGVLLGSASPFAVSLSLSCCSTGSSSFRRNRCWKLPLVINSDSTEKRFGDGFEQEIIQKDGERNGVKPPLLTKEEN